MSLSHRFICPHCHAPIDPTRMELARHGVQAYRICPDCDEAIALVAVAPPERHDPLFVSPDQAPGPA